MDKHKVSNQQIFAKKYIEDNCIESIISEMLNSLVMDKSKQPIIYMIKYLVGLLSEEERRINNINVPEPYPKGKSSVKYPFFPEKSKCLLKKHLSPNIWNSIKHNKTKLGGTIANLIRISEADLKFEGKAGILLTDSECIEQYNRIIEPIILDQHKIKKLEDIKYDKPVRNSKPLFLPHLSEFRENIKHIRIESSRNIKNIAFPTMLTFDRREKLNNSFKNLISDLEKVDNEFKGKYFDMYSQENDAKELLQKNFINYEGLDNFLEKAGLKTDWPEGRSFFKNDNNSIIIRTNYVDHLNFSVISDNTRNNTNDCFLLLNKLLDAFEKGSDLEFQIHKGLGYITSCPCLFGYGLEISFTIQLKNIHKDPYLEDILFENFDSYLFGSNNYLTVTSKYKYCYGTEINFVESVYSKLINVIQIDLSKNFFQEQIKIKSLDKGNTNLDTNCVYEAYNSSFIMYRTNISSEGTTINDLINNYNTNLSLGLVVNGEHDFKIFKNFFGSYLRLRQHFDESVHRHDCNKVIEFRDLAQLKEIKKNIKKINISLIRNLRRFPFVTSKFSQNKSVAELLLNTIKSLSDSYIGMRYISIDQDIPQEDYEVLTKKGIDFFIKFDKENPYKGPYYTSDRGIYILEIEADLEVYLIINDLNHIRFELIIDIDRFSEVDNFKISHCITSFFSAFNIFKDKLGEEFTQDDRLGYLNSSPKFLGSGVKMNMILKLQNYLKNEQFIMHKVSTSNKFSYEIIDNMEGTILLKNIITLGRYENEIINDIFKMANSLVEKDNEA